MILYLKLGPFGASYKDELSGLYMSSKEEVSAIAIYALNSNLTHALTTRRLVFATATEYYTSLKNITNEDYSSSNDPTLIIYTQQGAQGQFIPSAPATTTSGGSGTGLVPTGVMPGTYQVVVVDIYGRVISGSNPTYANKAEFIFNEAPTGLANGSNTVFTLAYGPYINTQSVFRNGVLQTPGTHYTISGDVITFLTAPASGSDIRANYIKED